MARKYLRALQYTTSTNGRDIPIFMRLCYEFWGYCVNGTASLTTPGGMPATPTSAPAGFFEGASVLATGSDGVTHDVGINFDSPSANFPITYIGKHITLWKEGSTSTDDSIYRIVNVPSPTQLQLAPFSGGTPDISTLKNNLTSRSFVNYRVIDVIAASQLAVASGNYFVGTLSGASGVNVGQANSQFQMLLRGSSQPFGQFGMVGSPAGTWTGAAFTGTTLTERTTASTTNFTGTSANVQGYVTLIADTDFFLGHIRTPNSNTTAGLYFYVIVPQRLYTQAQDTNLLTMMVGGNNLLCSVATDSHTSSFGMVFFNNSTNTCQLMTRNFVGDGVTGTSYTLGPNLSGLMATQARTGQVVYSNAIISNIAVAGSYALARAQMRIIAFTSNIYPSFHLLGNNGEFIHMGNGLLWPWDGAVMPNALLPLGT